MWLFTELGFYSVVEVEERESAAWGKSEQGTRVMIRARDPNHLLGLAERYFPDAVVYQTPSADYQYRIVVEKDAWAEAAKAMAESIDYQNFKAHVEHSSDSMNLDLYANALYRVWATMATTLGLDWFPLYEDGHASEYEEETP